MLFCCIGCSRLESEKEAALKFLSNEKEVKTWFMKGNIHDWKSKQCIKYAKETYDYMYGNYSKIKYFQNDSTPLFFAELSFKFKNLEDYISHCKAVNKVSIDIYKMRLPRTLSVSHIHEIPSEIIQMKILEAHNKNDSVVFVGNEANIVAQSLFTLVEPYNDSVVVRIRNLNFDKKIYLSNLAEHIDTTCSIKDSLELELQYLGNGLFFYSLETTGSTHGIDRISIVDKWKNEYIPILEICRDCRFKKIDSNHCRLTGIVETTKARGDALFTFIKPQLQFYAYKKDSVLAQKEEKDFCYEMEKTINELNKKGVVKDIEHIAIQNEKTTNENNGFCDMTINQKKHYSGPPRDDYVGGCWY
jgi:hypothetical protein